MCCPPNITLIYSINNINICQCVYPALTLVPRPLAPSQPYSFYLTLNSLSVSPSFKPNESEVVTE